MSDVEVGKYASAFVGGHRSSKRSIKWTRGAEANKTRVITRGAMRGKRVSTYQVVPVGPITATRRTTVYGRERAENTHKAVLRAKYSDLEQRLAQARAKFYQLPG